MRRWLVSALLLGSVLVVGRTAPAEEAPRFNDFPGRSVFAGRNAPPVLVSREARLFRTMIGQAARDQRPDFDGHYIVTFWGCGTNCAAGAIIDAVGGGVTMLPVVSDYFTGADDDGPDFTFRLDSRLFIINGMIRDKPPRGLHYFAFDGRRLKHLLTMEKPAPKAAESR